MCNIEGEAKRSGPTLKFNFEEKIFYKHGEFWKIQFER